MASVGNIGKVPELQKRLLFTIAMLAVCRLGVQIPTPGVDKGVLLQIFENAQNSVLGMFSAFTGGAFEQMSVLGLGIMPYISASIILDLLTMVIPQLDRLKKEGDQGRKKIKQYTRYLTVALCMFQGLGVAVWLESLNPGGQPVVPNPGFGFRFLTLITLTAGTTFLMWIGEQITERGIGNGISLVIFAGIVADMPGAIVQLITGSQTQMGIPKIAILLILMVIVIGAIIFMERGQRRIPVRYAKRMVGRRQFGGINTHLPIKINTTGVIPPIFASSLLVFPSTIANMLGQKYEWVQSFSDMFNPTHIIYNIFYVALIIFFSYFYTAIIFNPVDLAENLRKNGGYIPGQRPGKNTADFIDRILTRLTLGGAIYVALVCILPTIIINQFGVSFYFGGTGLLIVVGVAMDTIAQIESHMLQHSYEGFLGPGGPRFKGRRAR